jgi:exosortase H (IPTLxxWG-CTERM-specific)
MKTESKLAVFLRRQRDGVRFCALFTLFTVLVFAGVYATQSVLVVPLNHHFAWITEQWLRLVGGHASSSGPVVSLSSFAVEIRNNCNAIFEVGLYAAAVWAYPASWRDRLLGTLVGASVLYVVNVLRIVTLLMVGLLQPSWFEVMHLYAWQTLFLLVVTTCWIAWVSWIRPVA